MNDFVVDFGWPLEELERLRAEGGGGHEIVVFFGVELECLSQDAKRPCQTMKYIIEEWVGCSVLCFRMFS